MVLIQIGEIMAKKTKTLSDGSKKGVKFDDMSTGQKVIHVWGWVSVVGFGLSLIGVATGTMYVARR